VIIFGFLILALGGTPECDQEEAKVKDSVMLKEEATNTVVSGMRVYTPLALTVWRCNALTSVFAMFCHIKWQGPFLFGSCSG